MVITVTAPTLTTLSANPSTSVTTTTNVTLTAQVAETGGGTAAPTGTVTFTDNGTTLGGASVGTNGTATLTVSGLATGSNVINASYGGDANNDTSSASISLTVTAPAATTTTLSANPSTSVTTSDSVTLTAQVAETSGSATPTGTVTFYDNGTPLGGGTLANGTVTLPAGAFSAGTNTITASYGGDPGDASSTSSPLTLNVTAPAATEITKTTVTTSPSQITSDTSVVITANVVQTQTLTPAGGANVTFDANGNLIGTALLDANGNASITIGGWQAGVYTITASYVGDIFANDAASSGQTQLSVVGATAPLTVSAPTGLTMTYGGSLPNLTPSYSGFVNNDTSPTTPATCLTTATTASPPGTYPVTCSGAADSTYTFSYFNSTITVNPAPVSVTVLPTTTTYGLTTLPTLTPVYTGLANGDTAGKLSAQATCTPGVTASAGAATYTVICSGASDPNYTFSYVNSTLTINPAPLTITAPSLSLILGAVLPTMFTPTYSGLVNGDTSSSLTTGPTCTTTAGSSSPAGSYPTTCTGAADANYTITYVAGTLTITSPTPTCITGLVYGYTVTSGQSVCFGPNAVILGPLTVNPGGALTISGSIILGPVQINGATSVEICGSAIFGPLNVNGTTGAVVVGNGGSCAGSILVGPVSLTGNTAGVSLVGDGIGGPTAITGNAGGVTVDNDAIAGSLTVTGNTGTITVSGNNVQGPSNIQSPPSPLTVTAPSVTLTAGSTLPTFTPTYAGFVHGNTVSSLMKQATCATTATSSSPAGAYAITCSGAAGADYTISYVAGTLTIKPAPPAPPAPPARPEPPGPPGH
jgi:hypothetical protein